MFGAQQPIPPVRVAGVSAFQLLHSLALSFSEYRSSRRLRGRTILGILSGDYARHESARGRLRRSINHDSRAHVFICSHYLERELIAGLRLENGFTKLLVDGYTHTVDVQPWQPTAEEPTDDDQLINWPSW